MTGAQMGDHASLRGPKGGAACLVLPKLSTQDGPGPVLWTRWLCWVREETGWNWDYLEKKKQKEKLGQSS